MFEYLISILIFHWISPIIQSLNTNYVLIKRHVLRERPGHPGTRPRAHRPGTCWLPSEDPQPGLTSRLFYPPSTPDRKEEKRTREKKRSRSGKQWTCDSPRRPATANTRTRTVREKDRSSQYGVTLRTVLRRKVSLSHKMQ